MAVDITLKQAVFLFIDAWHLKKKARKLIDSYDPEDNEEF